MTQRLIAALTATVLTIGLLGFAALDELPFAVYRPGPTVDVLGNTDGSDGADGTEVIQVNGQKTYRDSGQLRMTTVSVSPALGGVGAAELFTTWLNPDSAVYPYASVHPDDQSQQESQTEGNVQMVTSQDTAVAVALKALGYNVKTAIEVFAITDGSPAKGTLQVRDLFLEAAGSPVTGPGVVSDAIAATPPGDPVDFVVLRDGKRTDVSVVPEPSKDGPRVGIQLGTGYRFPFKVSIGIDPAIGGPSAGLMFSLAVYDTLTSGSLTGGEEIAGTGTIAPDGSVGPIGGIQQKIAGADRDGAQLFLVPSDDCSEAVGADNGDMRLVEVDTMKSALGSIKAWVADHDASLPTCGASG